MIIELNDRKKQVLEAIIDDYVETAEPVGSFTVTHHYIRKVSPATVRSEMAELEHIGYLTHPHTSSGRIPTDLGYRYFVDNIMETRNISGRDITLIKSGIKKIGRGLEEVLHGTAKLISSVLNYFSVFVTFPKNHSRIFSHGLSNILRQPEFQSSTSARHIVEVAEHEEILPRILKEYARADSVNLRIGHENPFREMQDLSVMVARCSLRGMDPGVIGILGPTRMDYNRVRSVLDFISRELDELLKETIHVRS